MTTGAGDGTATPRVAQLVRAHAATVDPWLREAAGWGVDAATARAALADLEPLVVTLDDAAASLAVVRATLDLVARGRWHAQAVPRGVVLQVLPRLAPWVRAHPAVTVPAVLAAAQAIARTGLLDAWVGHLATVAPPPAGDLVRPALLVASWRCGLARYRDAALAAAAALPADVAGGALGVPPGDVPATLVGHGADRWWWPDRPAVPGVVVRVGGFTGWGGPWSRVPRAAAGGPTGWLAVVEGTSAAVVADVHGAAVVGLPDVAPPRRSPRRGATTLPVPWVDQVTAVVPGEGGAVLVSRAHSYTLDVVRVEGR